MSSVSAGWESLQRLCVPHYRQWADGTGRSVAFAGRTCWHVKGLAPPDRHKFEELEVQISNIDRFDDSHPGVNDLARGKEQVSAGNLDIGEEHENGNAIHAKV